MWRRLACLLWLACARGWPHMDSRDSAFPYGYQPTEQERKMVAPNEMTGVFMGGRHSVDGNEPDVQRLAQWSMSHVDECLHAQFPRFQKVTLSRVLKAEKQLMTVLDCRYFLTIEATVREPPAEPAAGMVDDGAVPTRGETVVDLGCGAGHDVLLAAKLVGSAGRVIGVDLTQAMLDRASRNMEEFGAGVERGTVEFRQGVLDDGTALAGVVDEGVADLAISNGVFNLAADKAAAFRSAYRVLKPGGRFQLCDVCKVSDTEAAVRRSQL